MIGNFTRGARTCAIQSGSPPEDPTAQKREVEALVEAKLAVECKTLEEAFEYRVRMKT